MFPAATLTCLSWRVLLPPWCVDRHHRGQCRPSFCMSTLDAVLLQRSATLSLDLGYYNMMVARPCVACLFDAAPVTCTSADPPSTAASARQPQSALVCSCVVPRVGFTQASSHAAAKLAAQEGLTAVLCVPLVFGFCPLASPTLLGRDPRPGLSRSD